MRADMIAGLVFVAVAVLVYSANWQPSFEPTLGDPGSMLLPSVVAIAMGVLGALLSVQALLKARAQRIASSGAPAGRGDHRLAVTGTLATVALVAYVALLPYLGYLASTVLFFFAASFTLGKRSRRSAAIYLVVSLVIAVLTYYLLSLGLKISLPEGSLLNAVGQSYA